MCMSGVKFLKACQVRDKIIQIFPKKNQPQNKGLGMLSGQSYITPMMSHDVISEIRGGVGSVIQEGGLSWKVTSLKHWLNTSHFN